jgi:hypothetical protein
MGASRNVAATRTANAPSGLETGQSTRLTNETSREIGKIAHNRNCPTMRNFTAPGPAMPILTTRCFRIRKDAVTGCSLSQTKSIAEP